MFQHLEQLVFDVNMVVEIGKKDRVQKKTINCLSQFRLT